MTSAFGILEKGGIAGSPNPDSIMGLGQETGPSLLVLKGAKESCSCAKFMMIARASLWYHRIRLMTSKVTECAALLSALFPSDGG
jgi:hypothetical protein